MFPFLTQLFLYGFCIDAVLSFWAELYHIQSGSFSEIRMLIAFSALMQGTILYVCMAFTRRLSFRLVGWPALFLLWANLTGCFPLPMFYLKQPGLWMASVQMLMAFSLIGVAWHSQAVAGGPGFLDPAMGREGFTWRRFLRFAGANFFLLPLLAITALLGNAVESIEKATAGYVRLRPSGLYITQSSFTKDRHTVALDGMVHVADADFYQTIKWGIDGVKTLVLLEGVSDENHLLSGGLGMEKLAKYFGLNSQMERGEYRQTLDKMTAKEDAGEVAEDGSVEIDQEVDVRRADVDVKTFRPQTINYLKSVALLYQSTQTGKMESFLKVMEDKKDVLQNDRVVRGAMEDILINRNTHLIRQIEKGLETHNRIVVPWGAMHLAGIEQYLRSKGFSEVSREEKPAVLFWKSRP
ncbi:MAG: hypothetical protein ABIT76_12785 [Chthoniobacterales bacterium]